MYDLTERLIGQFNSNKMYLFTHHLDRLKEEGSLKDLVYASREVNRVWSIDVETDNGYFIKLWMYRKVIGQNFGQNLGVQYLTVYGKSALAYDKKIKDWKLVANKKDWEIKSTHVYELIRYVEEIRRREYAPAMDPIERDLIQALMDSF